MTPQQIVDALRPILDRNYTALGFELKELKFSEDTGSVRIGKKLTYIQGMLLCPCGGIEYFSFTWEGKTMYVKENKLKTVQKLAYNVLSFTASRKHLEDDIKKGILPAFNIEKHVFGGVLI